MAKQTPTRASKQRAAETAERLIPIDWATIDELFAKAGLEWLPEPTVDGKHAYLTAQLDRRPLGKVLAVDAFAENVPSQPQDDLSWAPNTVRLFISHSAAEREAAGDLKRILAPLRVDGFVAHDSIEFDREWRDVIVGHLGSCHALLALVSDHFSSSEWCDQEVGWALGRGVPVMSINAGSPPYGFIGPRQALPFKGDYADVARKVLARLLELPSTARLATEALVSALELASGYDAASGIIALLDSATGWDSRLIGRMERAPKHNDQVRNADWGRAVPRIQAIAKRAAAASG